MLLPGEQPTLTRAERALLPPMTEDEARAYIAKVRWIFARTMPQAPHEYTVRTWRPELEADFFRFRVLIWNAGRRSHFHGRPRRYYALGEFEYFLASRDPIEDEAMIINRALIAPREQGKLPV